MDRMIDQKEELNTCIQHTLNTLWPGLFLAQKIVLRRPPPDMSGDWACSIAFMLCKPLRQSPLLVAERLADSLPSQHRLLIERCQAVAPGFLNITLHDAVRWQIVDEILQKDECYGDTDHGQHQSIILEYVSANPTGPLHVGHGRQAVIGDGLAAVFATQGWRVWREFYYNDGGQQIHNLVLSVQARAKNIKPGSDHWPQGGYRGPYVEEIARDFLSQPHHALEDMDAIRHFAIACIRREQLEDLQTFHMHFDQYFLESSLYTSGEVSHVVEGLIEKNKTYEKEGALWLKTTLYRDDKDRVMRKSNGEYTYFVPDVAYHVNKFKRGFQRAINIQGSDHQGTTTRVQAGLQALGIGLPVLYPEYVLHSMVKIIKGGKEVTVSKRAGSYVTLRELIQWVGQDAVRFLFALRRPDAPLVFDVDLAVQQTEDNPVYYVQYAFARICSVLNHPQQSTPTTKLNTAALPHTQHTVALLHQLADYSSVLTEATTKLTIHHIGHYLCELATLFHRFYNTERILVDCFEERCSKLALISAVAIVLRKGLRVLGVSAPSSM